jgi:Putative transmembrane protein precursor
MEGTIVWRHIQKLNKKLWQHNLIGIVLLLVLGCSQYRYLYNCFLGAQKINTEQLVKLEGADRIDRDFVTLTSSQIIDTGINEISVNKKTQIETIQAKYAIAILDRDKAILIKTQPEDNLKNITFTGKLSEIISDSHLQIFNRVVNDRPNLKSKISLLMLETGDYTSSADSFLFFLVGGLGICSWNLYKAKVRTENLRKHPIYRSLIQYGDGDLLADSIDNEIGNRYSSQELEANTLFVTPSWLLFTPIYNLQIVKFDRLMWAFKKVTNHSVNFIPTGKTYAIVLYDRFGKERNFSMSEGEVDLIIGNIHTYAPWTVIGYTSESRKMWDWRRKEFYTMVEQRQRTSQSRSGTDRAAPKQEGQPKATATTPRQESKPKDKVTSPDRAAKVNEKVPSPDRCKSATPKASADFDHIKSSLDGLAQLGWLLEESSWSANFTLDPRELSDLARLDRVVKALLDRARRVAPGLSVPMVPRIAIEPMPAAAGQFEVDEEGWVTIRVSPDFERDLPAARAILAHEVCHYILDNRGIRQPNFELNERDTDLCMFICGFGEVFLAGYKRSSTRNEYRPGHRLGYLTDAEYEFANRYTSELRATYRQNLQSELDVLKERLLRKAQGDRDCVRRLIEYERQRDRSLSEIELYRDAIARFDRD